MDANLFTQNSFRVPAFADTTAANAVTTLDSAGKIIYTYNVNGLWLRQNQPHKWSQIGSSSNPINDTVYVDAPLYAYFDSTGHQHIAIQQQDGLVGACPVVWDSLLVFSVPPCNYVINGTFYTSPATTITLDAADPTNPRYDLFIVDTVPEATKITGIPAAIPTIPQVDPQSQIALTSGFLINPGDTVPNNATQKLIYDENAGTPTEWAFTTSGTITANANNTDNPKHKTKAIFVSSYTNNSKLNFLSASTDTFNTNNGQVLWGYVYFNGAFLNKFKFQFFNGSTAVSSALTINNTFGLNPNDSNRYQLFSIPLSAFTWTNTVFDKLVITHVGTDNSGAKGYYIDWINIQSGVMPIPSPIDYSNKADSAGTYKINDSTYITRTWVKGSSFPVGDTIHASSTGGGGGGSGTVTSISQGYGIVNTPNPITTTGTIKVDSAALHLTFMEFSDTVSLSNRINLKLNISDTINKWVQSAGLSAGGDSLIVTKNAVRTATKIIPSGVGTVTSIATSAPITGGTITTTGTIGITAMNATTNGYVTAGGSVNKVLHGDGTWKDTTAAGTGTVTSIATGYGLSGGTITTTGTIIVDSAALSLKYLRIVDTTNKWVQTSGLSASGDSLIVTKNGVRTASKITSGGTGTVTSIATTAPILGGTITTTGTISVDTGRGNTQLTTGYDLNKVRDSLYNLYSGNSVAYGTYAQKIALSSPFTGQRFYQTDERIGFWQWTGVAWEFIFPSTTRGIFNNAIVPTASTSGTGSSSGWSQVGGQLDSSYGGGYAMLTGTTTTGRAGFQYPNGNYSYSPSDTTWESVTCLRVLFDTASSSDNFTVRFGFGSQNINTSAIDNYGTYFRIDNDSAAANLVTITHNNAGSVNIGTNTGITQHSLAGRFHDYVIVSNSIRTKYYLDGTLLATDANPLSGGTVQIIGPGPIFVASIIKKTGTNSKFLSVAYAYSYTTKIY